MQELLEQLCAQNSFPSPGWDVLNAWGGARATELGPSPPGAGTAAPRHGNTRGTTGLQKGTAWNGLLVVLAVL